MEVEIDQIVQQCMNAMNSKFKNLKKLNIVVVGKSGVGKSTLINSLFCGNFVETGIGRPVTLEMRKIEKVNYPLAIYDTPGFELSQEQQNKVKDEVIEVINKGIASRDINEAIHCIWYCINVGGNRTFDLSEVEWLKDFSKSNKKTQVPIIIVLTQACPRSKAEKMKKLVEKENLNIVKVIPVLAQDMNLDDEYVVRAYGLEELIKAMSEILPSELQETLQNAQRVSLESKKKRAQAVVATTVATSFGAGFAPIPFSDAVVLVPTQVAMIAAITTIYGFNISKSFLTSLVSSTIGSAGTTVLGKTIASNLLKLIPGFGTVVGGTISGATAGILTTALGETYIKVMESMYKGELKKENLYDGGRKEMKRIFKEEIKKQRK
ncbi:MAG TPA: DUF697 domain-containing protein [Candidatus Fimimorpha faecalis]|uniref:DUF697 domain-containing protein n=1 Tax=Candidatus Fimimorpha faecalis TaxID=2840824 RepID=A0A9D1JD30_9FIRM|nr:DUF697 domain-containing protein [Candidatus Fimimorpha faecalis]